MLSCLSPQALSNNLANIRLYLFHRAVGGNYFYAVVFKAGFVMFGFCKKTLTNASMEGFALLLHAIQCALETRGGGFGRHIEHNRQVGRKSIGSHAANSPKRIGIEPSGTALINDVCQQEAVGNNRLAFGQGRADNLFDQLRTGGHVQQHLAATVNLKIVTIKQQFTYRLAKSGAAGIATGNQLLAKLAEPLTKQFDLGRLTRPIAAVD
jgi:hypothetical protein